MLARMPGATYRPEGEAQERRLCAIDFHQPTHALCPKLFSTSPGTLVYDLSAGPYAGRPAEFEREVCSPGHVVTTEAVGGAISYKMSVNTRETSATFANSSLDLLPLRALLRRRGARAAGGAAQHRQAGAPGARGAARRVGVGHPAAAEDAARRLVDRGARRAGPGQLPAHRRTVHARPQTGLRRLLHPEGKRYGDEVNGSRQSGWGEGQSRDFQQTAPFIALASDKPLAEAIRQGIAQGHASSAIPADVAPSRWRSGSASWST